MSSIMRRSSADCQPYARVVISIALSALALQLWQPNVPTKSSGCGRTACLPSRQLRTQCGAIFACRLRFMPFTLFDVVYFVLCTFLTALGIADCMP